MHAVVIGEFGDPAVLRPDSFPDPTDRPGWVTVELKAAALNWHDVLVRQGRYRSPLPHVIGADGAGVRRDTGDEVVIVPSLHWGEREEAPGAAWEILGDHIPGTYAELVSVPAECLAPKPAGFSWAMTLSLPTRWAAPTATSEAAFTAWWSSAAKIALRQPQTATSSASAKMEQKKQLGNWARVS